MSKKVGSDIEIARAATMKPIEEVAAKLDIPDKHLYRYGPYKAKLSFEFIEGLKSRPDGKLILVTAITPRLLTYALVKLGRGGKTGSASSGKTH